MKNMKFAVLLALGLTLSACAPAVLGSQVLNPLIGGTGIERAKVQAGQTVYIQYVYPRSFFDLPDGRFVNPVVGITNRNTDGTLRSPESQAGWLTMKADNLPNDWKVTLAEAAIRKEVVRDTTAGDTINVRYFERVRVVYKVTVPSGATGSSLALLTFMDGTAEVGKIPLTISVGDVGGPTVGAQF